ncbi:MAG: ion channel [Pseudomonadota bacterium]
MFDQLLLGAGVTLLSLIFATTLWWSFTELMESMDGWLRKPPQPFKYFVIMVMVVFATMLIMSFGVWLWAIIFYQMAVFPTLEEAVYYSLVAYTTLGLGDVVVPQEQRLLGGMTGANGFMMFGLMTAMLTDTLRHVRRVQHNIQD